MGPRLSLILPVYNERDRLSKNFKSIYDEAKRLGTFEIIIAEDGSTDGSKELANRLSKRDGVKVLSVKGRTGRGGAIKRAVKIAHGNVIGYIDIDLAVPLRYMKDAIKLVEDGHPVVTGSRYEKGSDTTRSIYRHIASKSYNLLLKVLLSSKVKDHQCGFKFWSGKYIKKAIKDIKDNHWFFDSEMLVRAERTGITPYELPVEWHEGRETKVRLKDNIYFVKQILRLRSELAMPYK